MAFLSQTYGTLCDSESRGSWIFSFSFETERQPGRSIPIGKWNTGKWGEGTGAVEQSGNNYLWPERLEEKSHISHHLRGGERDGLYVPLN